MQRRRGEREGGGEREHKKRDLEELEFGSRVAFLKVLRLFIITKLVFITILVYHTASKLLVYSCAMPAAINCLTLFLIM